MTLYEKLVECERANLIKQVHIDSDGSTISVYFLAKTKERVIEKLLFHLEKTYDEIGTIYSNYGLHEDSRIYATLCMK